MECFVYNTKVDGKSITQFVSHNQSFCLGVQELCAIREHFVKVLHLVDGEKPTMGYLYEIVNSAKEVIH